MALLNKLMSSTAFGLSNSLPGCIFRLNQPQLTIWFLREMTIRKTLRMGEQTQTNCKFQIGMKQENQRVQLTLTNRKFPSFINEKVKTTNNLD